MVLTKKFSQFENVTPATINDANEKLVGLENGANMQSTRFFTWTTASRPPTPFDGLQGFNTTIKLEEYYDSSIPGWVPLAPNAGLSGTFIVQTPSVLLPNAQALSALTTGILKSTTVTGVVSISAPLTSIDGLTTAANEMLYTTGSNTYATTGLTALARSLLADSTTAAMQSTLGLGTAAVKNATDNAQPNVASVNGSFTVGHVAVFADTSGTIQDSGSPAGTGTVTNIATNNGVTGGPITTTGTIGLASIANNNLLANISGISNPPSATALTDLIDSAIGNTQGDVLYRNASAWVVLAPGTNGQFLQTQGAAANVQWASAGTVTSVATGTGLTGGPITTTGTISFASIADQRILANISGGSAAPIANTLTAIIDSCIGSTQGDILYRNATSWVVLPPGTAGQVLSTGGAAANPSWTAAGGTGTVTSVGTAGLATGGPITTSGTVTVTAAVKSDQQTATSNSVAVTPGVQQYHPSATQAWVYATVSGGVATAQQSYNLASIGNNATGNYTANFTTAFAAATFAVEATVNTGNGTQYYFWIVKPTGVSSAQILTATGTAAAPVATDVNFTLSARGAQ